MVNNIKISCFEVKDKFVKGYNKFFKNAKVETVDLAKILNEAKNDLSGDKLVKEYALFKYLYENGGLLLDGNFKFIKSINSFLNHDFFIGFRDDKYIATNIIYSKEKGNELVKEILDLIKTQEYEDITDVLSKITGKNLYENYNYVLKIKDNSFIYPYDFFYPIDYEKVGKGFSGNIKALFFDSSKKMGFRQKYKVHVLNMLLFLLLFHLFQQ